MKEEMGECLDEWEREGCGHRLLPRGRQIPGIGVRREGWVMRGRGQGSQRARASERRKEARARRGPGRAWGIY